MSEYFNNLTMNKDTVNKIPYNRSYEQYYILNEYSKKVLFCMCIRMMKNEEPFYYEKVDTFMKSPRPYFK